jgi:hypothetical protein
MRLATSSEAGSVIFCIVQSQTPILNPPEQASSGSRLAEGAQEQVTASPATARAVLSIIRRRVMCECFISISP